VSGAIQKVGGRNFELDARKVFWTLTEQTEGVRKKVSPQISSAAFGRIADQRTPHALDVDQRSVRFFELRVPHTVPK
jgi:hypothetical protein